MDEHIEKGLTRSLAQRLFMTHATNRTEFELLVKAIFHIGPAYLKVNKGYTFDYDALIDLLWNFEGMPAERFYKGKEKEYSCFLDTIFDKAPFPYLFHSRLIHEIINDGRKIPVNINAFINYQIIYFYEYVNNKSLDTTAISLMWTMRKKKIYVNEVNNVRNEEYLFVDEVKPHILEFVRTHELTEFIKGSIKREGGQGYCIYPAILDIFKGSNSLYMN